MIKILNITFLYIYLELTHFPWKMFQLLNIEIIERNFKIKIILIMLGPYSIWYFYCIFIYNIIN